VGVKEQIGFDGNEAFMLDESFDGVVYFLLGGFDVFDQVAGAGGMEGLVLEKGFNALQELAVLGAEGFVMFGKREALMSFNDGACFGEQGKYGLEDVLGDFRGCLEPVEGEAWAFGGFFVEVAEDVEDLPGQSLDCGLVDVESGSEVGEFGLLDQTGNDNLQARCRELGSGGQVGQSGGERRGVF